MAVFTVKRAVWVAVYTVTGAGLGGCIYGKKGRARGGPSAGPALRLIR